MVNYVMVDYIDVMYCLVDGIDLCCNFDAKSVQCSCAYSISTYYV